MQKDIYTFWTIGYLEIDGEMVNTLDIALSPAEVQSIYDWFAFRNNRWISFIPQAFRNHNQELYDKLYTSLVELANQANPDISVCDNDWDEEEFPEIEYDPSIDPTSYDSPFALLHWPHRIFKELNINEPNVTIWVNEEGDDDLQGMGYPIYLEEKYYNELNEIKQTYFMVTSYDIRLVNINAFKQTHPDLYTVIKNRVDDILPEYGVNIKNNPPLVYSLINRSFM